MTPTPDPALAARLLPCPFCGGKAHNYSQSRFWIGCKDCGAEMPIFLTEAAASEAWNSRAPADHEAAIRARKGDAL